MSKLAQGLMGEKIGYLGFIDRKPLDTRSPEEIKDNIKNGVNALGGG